MQIKYNKHAKVYQVIRKSVNAWMETREVILFESKKQKAAQKFVNDKMAA